MSISTVFNRGLDGLTVNMRGLAVASNNIANVNTKGYARQTIEIGARATGGNGDLTAGGGAEVLGQSSITSPFVEMQLFNTANSFGTLDGRRQTVGQLESLMAQSQENGLGKSLNEFFNGWSQLANDPGSIALRQGMKEKATLLASQFNTMSKNLNRMRSDLSSEITTRVDSINSKAQEIAKLNQAIVTTGGAARNPDLVARRTYVLRELSTEINTSYYETDGGAVQVQVAGSTSLVENFTAGTLVASDNLGDGGQMAIKVEVPGANTQLDITNNITGGRLFGNLTDRNTTLNTQMSDLDSLAYNLVTRVNGLHATGYALDGSTGNTFFGALSSSTAAAKNIALDSGVANNVKLIAAAGASPTSGSSGTGDNRMALQLADLRSTKTMSSGTETFSEFYGGMVSSSGITAGSVNKDYESQQTLLNQIEMQRESVSGVNMDEEGANIIRFQRAFQASSKLMQVADKMLETLLGMGGS